MYYTNGVDFSLELVTREDELTTFVSNSLGDFKGRVIVVVGISNSNFEVAFFQNKKFEVANFFSIKF